VPPLKNIRINLLVLDPLFTWVTQTEITGLRPRGEVKDLIPFCVVKGDKRPLLGKVALLRPNSHHIVPLTTKVLHEVST
jgi:hypothetical protein